MNRKCMQTLFGMLGLVLLVAPSGLTAQTCDGIQNFPCGYAIADLSVQRVPALFKLQARVAQAKLPVGEGTFNAVVVKLVQGTQVLCLEQFSNVQVKESVLNLEIGRNMSCELDEYIARYADLAFQVCLGGSDNCLKPVALAATPYAVKATYAAHATDALKATAAAQANYAYRVTADKDLINTKAIGTGYFDFYTPGAGQTCNAAWLPGNPVCDANDGYLQWTPVRNATSYDLTVAGKTHATGQMRELDSLVLASEKTTATGDFRVTPSAVGTGLTVTAQGAHVVGRSDVAGPLTIAPDQTTLSTFTDQGLTVKSQGAHVTGDSTFDNKLTVKDATTISAGGIHVTGASDIAGATTVSSGGIHVTGASDIAGDTTVTGKTVLNGTANVGGTLTVTTGGAKITGNSNVTGTLTVSGETRVKNKLVFDDATASLSLGTGTSRMLTVSGPVTFEDAVIFNGGQSTPNPAYVLRTGETRPVDLGDDLSVAKNLAVTGTTTTGKLKTGNIVVQSGEIYAEGTGWIYLNRTAGDVVYVGGETKASNLHVSGNANVVGSVSANSFSSAGDVYANNVISRYYTVNDAINPAGGTVLFGQSGSPANIRATGDVQVDGHIYSGYNIYAYGDIASTYGNGKLKANYTETSYINPASGDTVQIGAWGGPWNKLLVAGDITTYNDVNCNDVYASGDIHTDYSVYAPNGTFSGYNLATSYINAGGGETTVGTAQNNSNLLVTGNSNLWGSVRAGGTLSAEGGIHTNRINGSDQELILGGTTGGMKVTLSGSIYAWGRIANPVFNTDNQTIRSAGGAGVEIRTAQSGGTFCSANKYVCGIKFAGTGQLDFYCCSF